MRGSLAIFFENCATISVRNNTFPRRRRRGGGGKEEEVATVESQFVPVRVAGKMEGTREGRRSDPPNRLEEERRRSRGSLSWERTKEFLLLTRMSLFRTRTPLFDPLSFPIVPRPPVHFRNVIHSRRDPPKSLMPPPIHFIHFLSVPPFNKDASSSSLGRNFSNCIIGRLEAHDRK